MQNQVVKFYCAECKAKYSLPIDRIKNKVLKIRCKQCQSLIEVKDPNHDHSLKQHQESTFT